MRSVIVCDFTCDERGFCFGGYRLVDGSSYNGASGCKLVYMNGDN